MKATAEAARLALKRLAGIVAMAAFFPGAILAQGTVAGQALNRTRNRPDAGDAAILLRFTPAMQQEARLKTDARGGFSFVEQHPRGNYLVRILHDGVNYDHPAIIGQPFTIAVYDAVRTRPVRGISGTIEIFQAGLRGKFLHISDMYEVVNQSKPPVTEAGSRTFDVYVPPNAKFDLVLAASPAKIPEVISVKPARGQAGHYSVNFPLQPGATKFAFDYDLPYSGKLDFRPRCALSVQQFAVMIPPTMKFSSSSRQFSPLPVGGKQYRVEAVNSLAAGLGPTFELSGFGSFPPANAHAGQDASAMLFRPPSERSVAAVRSGSHLSQAIASVKQSKSWMAITLMGMAVLILFACGFLFWHARSRGRAAFQDNRETLIRKNAAPLMDALRLEQERLEDDRQRGAISEAEYDSTRQALQIATARASKIHK